MRAVGFCVATVVATSVGYATYVPGMTISLIWPMAGVGMLWLTTATRRTLPWDAVLLAATTSATLLVSRASVPQAVVAVVLALLQPAVYVAIMRRWAPDLWGSGGRRPLSRPRDLGAFLAAALVSALVAALVRMTGLGLIPTGDLSLLTLTWIRNFSWMLSIGAVGLMVGPALSSFATGGHLGLPGRAPGWQRRLAEAVAIFAVTALLYVVLFSESDPLPLTFVLSLATVWAAARLPPVVATTHALLSGTAAVVLTLSGSGVFYAVPDARVSAALSQSFLVGLVITALTLALTTAERSAAIARALASEHAAEERATMLGGVMESMREGLVVVQDDGTIIVRNPAGRRLVDLDGTDPDPRILPAGGYGFIDARGNPLPEDQMPAALFFSGHEVIGRDYFIRTPRHPAGRVLEMSVTPVVATSDTEHRRAIINFRDVTQERQDRDHLASFAGVVAHDLNNPLSIVTGWSEALAESFREGPVDPEDGTPMVARIQVAAAHMRQFIDDLLGYTIARDHPLRIEDLDLSVLAEGIAVMRRDSDTRPRIHVQPGMLVRADAAMMRQVLDNLIGNATKYVGPGVRPAVEVSAEQDGTWLRVSVSDNGIGVPPEMRERVFDDFQRAHTGRVRRHRDRPGDLPPRRGAPRWHRSWSGTTRRAAAAGSCSPCPRWPRPWWRRPWWRPLGPPRPGPTPSAPRRPRSGPAPGTRPTRRAGRRRSRPGWPRRGRRRASRAPCCGPRGQRPASPRSPRRPRTRHGRPCAAEQPDLLGLDLVGDPQDLQVAGHRLVQDVDADDLLLALLQGDLVDERGLGDLGG